MTAAAAKTRYDSLVRDKNAKQAAGVYEDDDAARRRDQAAIFAARQEWQRLVRVERKRINLDALSRLIGSMQALDVFFNQHCVVQPELIDDRDRYRTLLDAVQDAKRAAETSRARMRERIKRLMEEGGVFDIDNDDTDNAQLFTTFLANDDAVEKAIRQLCPDDDVPTYIAERSAFASRRPLGERESDLEKLTVHFTDAPIVDDTSIETHSVALDIFQGQLVRSHTDVVQRASRVRAGDVKTVVDLYDAMDEHERDVADFFMQFYTFFTLAAAKGRRAVYGIPSTSVLTWLRRIYMWYAAMMASRWSNEYVPTVAQHAAVAAALVGLVAREGRARIDWPARIGAAATITAAISALQRTFYGKSLARFSRYMWPDRVFRSSVSQELTFLAVGPTFDIGELALYFPYRALRQREIDQTREVIKEDLTESDLAFAEKARATVAQTEGGRLEDIVEAMCTDPFETTACPYGFKFVYYNMQDDPAEDAALATRNRQAVLAIASGEYTSEGQVISPFTDDDAERVTWVMQLITPETLDRTQPLLDSLYEESGPTLDSMRRTTTMGIGSVLLLLGGIKFPRTTLALIVLGAINLLAQSPAFVAAAKLMTWAAQAIVTTTTTQDRRRQPYATPIEYQRAAVALATILSQRRRRLASRSKW